MKNLSDIAIYVVNELKRNNIGFDPFEIGVNLANNLNLNSTDSETLMMGICIARKSDLEQDLIGDAKKTVSQMKEWKTIKQYTKQLK